MAALVIRTDRETGTFANTIRDAVTSVDPALPLYDSRTMDERVSASLSGRRFTVALLIVFAMASVFLASLGLYGVISYGVGQRTQEIGIRIALGAQHKQVVGLIVKQGLQITLSGLAVGLSVAAGITRLV